ncbi:MAG TPA: terminase family protein [Candidatus Sulfotelmatobacter sp.]|jgi:uncharacterized protein YjcR|nr:terminase family protein [Candidatus Sulfotelmatobacter sp.]
MYCADEDQRIKARNLYWQGYSPAEISRSLTVPYGTVDAWKRRDKWDDAPVIVRIEAHVEARLMRLIAKDEKTGGDLNEIDQLGRILERTARIQNYGQSGKEADLNPKVEQRAKNRRKKDEKNLLSEEQVAALIEAFHNDLFAYQEKWLDAKQYRVRNVLKSRQIGATWYFAREALIDAITTGDNQIFLSASKAQAHVFREYIVQFVKDVTGVVLKGDPITLWNGATLYFLGTNSKTAQSYHGHVYLDEYAWIGKFLEFRKVASAMATHKKWRITYFSTPSTIGHESHAFWSGATYNKGKAKADRVEFDISHAALKDGVLGPDGQWRQIVTIEDAEAGGCNLFDIEALRREYNDQDFANLFMAQWVDDDAAFFTFEEMRRCMVDSWDVWDDVNFALARPFGDRPVWIGYDPAKSGDNASIVVVAPPMVDGGRFRILEKVFVNGVDFQAQANKIKELCARYNVVHIGIDSTTIGQGVFQMVRQFFPAAREITYSVEVKTRLVLKAKQLVSKRRLEFDAGWTDVAMAFMAIKKTSTPSGQQATFKAGRSKETGHADVAWAVMHALDRLEFTDFDKAPGSSSGGFIEIC